MDIEIKKNENCVRTMKITVDAKTAENDYKKILKKYRGMVVVPGFRKGKAPLSIVENYYGKNAEMEFKESAIEKYYKKALKEKELKPISEGTPINVEWEKGKDFMTEIKYEVAPDIKIEKYKDLEIEFEKEEYDEKKLEEKIQKLKKEMKSYEELDKPAEDGLFVSVTMRIYQDDNDKSNEPKEVSRELEVNNNQYGKAFNQKLSGKKKGDEFEADLFDKDSPEKEKYSADIKIDSVYKINYPKIDDEFAQEAGYEDLENMKTKLKNEIEAEIEKNNEMKLQQVVLDKIIAENPFEVPFSQIQHLAQNQAKQLSQLGDKVDNQQLMQYFFESSKNQLKHYYVQNELRKKEDVTFTDADKENFIQEMAKNMNMNVDRYKELYKESIDSDDFNNAIKDKKILKKIIDSSNIVKPQKKTDEKDEEK